MSGNFMSKLISNIKNSFRNIWVFRNILITWIALVILLLVGLHFKLDTHLMVIGLSIIALLTKAFTGLMMLVSIIPFIGPLLVKILSLPFFWLLNALGYFASLFAIKKGYGKSVISYRILTIVFLTGVSLGYVLGRVIH